MKIRMLLYLPIFALALIEQPSLSSASFSLIEKCIKEQKRKMNEGLYKARKALSSFVFSPKLDKSLYLFLNEIDSPAIRAAVESFSYDIAQDEQLSQKFPTFALNFYTGIKEMLDTFHSRLEALEKRSKPLEEEIINRFAAKPNFDLSCENLMKAFEDLKTTDKKVSALYNIKISIILEAGFELMALVGKIGSEYLAETRQSNEAELEAMFADFKPRLLTAGTEISKIFGQLPKDILL